MIDKCNWNVASKVGFKQFLKSLKPQKMASAEAKEALYNTPENLDLEKEIEKYYTNSPKELGHVLFEDFHIMASHFANWQKEQMMKDAVYGLVCGHDEESPAWIDLNLFNKPNVNVGDEVKLIIVKEE